VGLKSSQWEWGLKWGLDLMTWKEPFQPSAGFVLGRVLGPGVTAANKTNSDEYYGENKTE